MRKYGFLIIFLTLSFFLGAEDFLLMDKDAGWIPDQGEEYLALNMAGILSSALQQTLMDGQAELPSFWDEERLSLDYRTSLFQLFVDGSVLNDGKYSEQEPYLGGRYLYLNSAFLNVNLDSFTLTAGQGPHRDVVDSPYSLFISSADISALHGEIDYKGDRFFFKTRWVSMNSNSSLTYYGVDGALEPTEGWPDSDTAALESVPWLDKGMNFKVYGVNLGDWQVGMEDVVVYLGRSFDPNYFLNPLPQYFVQLITTEGGTPWVESGNTKSMMGFFGKVNKETWGGEAQLLIDDINLDFLPFVPERSFKSKIAWNIGGWKAFDFGRMGFHHAGASKYTFESTRTIESGGDWGTSGYVKVPYSILPYEYTYYPVNEYELKNGDSMPIAYEDLYAGYKYGENNLAFLVDYENTLFSGSPFEFRLYSSFEYVMNGSKSPSNPWQEYDSSRNPNMESASFVLFTGAPIEHILRIKANARKKLGNFTIMTELMAGYVFNGAKLVTVEADYEDFAAITWTEPKIYVPQNGNNYPILQFTLGVNYNLMLQ